MTNSEMQIRRLWSWPASRCTCCWVVAGCRAGREVSVMQFLCTVTWGRQGTLHTHNVTYFLSQPWKIRPYLSM